MRRRLTRAILAAALIAGGALSAIPAAAPPALADPTGCMSTGQSGGGASAPGIDAGSITIADEIVVVSGTTCTGGGNVAASLPWSPPPCWWAPLYTPDQLKSLAASYAAADPLLDNYYQTDGGKTAEPAGYQSTDGPDYWDWNVDATPAGMWWGMVVNGAMLDTQTGFGDVLNCIASEATNTDGMDWSWTVNGTPDDINGDPVITDELLAEYAAETMNLPTTSFYSSPAAGTNLTVNLPTWLWMNGADYTPQTLSLCWEPTGNQYCSTVVATAQSFQIKTTAPDGDYTIFNGGCVPTTEADGTWIGTPFNDGNQGDSPPCGITYTHSSAGIAGGFGLSFTVNWSIAWNGGGPPNWPVPDPLTTDTVNYPVQEIQNIGGN